jgi:hypothetical protein
MSVHHHRASGRSFDIAPMLDRGWGYDPYVAHLIGRIRAGRPALECMFDANSLFLRSGQDTEVQRTAFKKREISAEEMAEYRADQEKRRLANEAIYADSVAKARAAKLEREREQERVKQEWAAARAERARLQREAEDEWLRANPLPPPRGMTIPFPGWWRKKGDDVVVAIMLHRHTATDVLIGVEGAALGVSKAQIKEVKNYLNGLHELTFDGEFARRVGFCNGEPTQWSS